MPPPTISYRTWSHAQSKYSYQNDSVLNINLASLPPRSHGLRTQSYLVWADISQWQAYATLKCRRWSQDVRLATGLVSPSFLKFLMAASVFSKSKPPMLLRMEKRRVREVNRKCWGTSKWKKVDGVQIQKGETWDEHFQTVWDHRGWGSSQEQLQPDCQQTQGTGETWTLGKLIPWDLPSGEALLWSTAFAFAPQGFEVGKSQQSRPSERSYPPDPSPQLAWDQWSPGSFRTKNFIQRANDNNPKLWGTSERRGVCVTLKLQINKHTGRRKGAGPKDLKLNAIRIVNASVTLEETMVAAIAKQSKGGRENTTVKFFISSLKYF